MVTMRTGTCKAIHVSGHNIVPHNDEAERLAKAGAQM